MLFQRGSGILLHLTSLPGRFGAGDLGPTAYRFVDFLARTGQSVWQVLPVGPTGYGNSPYQSLSTFAGNPLLISLDRLADEGWLSPESLQNLPEFSASEVQFDRVVAWRESLLQRAFRTFMERADARSRDEFARFRESEKAWLDDYALFRSLKAVRGESAWTAWEPEIVRRQPEALRLWSERLQESRDLECFLQFQFARQWSALKQYAHARQVQLIGDVPIFTAHDSADVWAHQELFQLDERGMPTVVAGVPPDYFSATGQRWGNPLYRWKAHARDGYSWWIQRLRRAFELFEFVRIDHFRGFESYWEIPGDAPDASSGQWVLGPGAALFRAAHEVLGPLPVIAEDLGVITPAVENLRDELGFPGMKVLQFAFGDDAKGADYRPHNYSRNCLVYTGTHDNDTTVGWFHSQAGIGSTRDRAQVERERAFTLAYADSDGREIHWDMIRLAWSSVADLAITPLQDVLGLGTEARMNLPGTATGNWKWRFTHDALTADIEQRLGELTALYDRSKSPVPWYMRPGGRQHAEVALSIAR